MYIHMYMCSELKCTHAHRHTLTCTHTPSHSHTHTQDPRLMIQTSQSLLTSTLAGLSSEPFMNVEVALRVFYLLGEVISDKVGAGFWNTN